MSFAWDRSIHHLAAVPLQLAALTAFFFLFTCIARALLLETHIGWRRLTIVLSVSAAVVAPAIYIEDIGSSSSPFLILISIVLATLVGTAAGIVYARKVILWVYSGFQSEAQQKPMDSPSAALLAPANKSTATPRDIKEMKPVPVVPPAPMDSLALKPTPKLAEFWPRLWARCIDLPLVFVLVSVIGAIVPGFDSLIPGIAGVITDMPTLGPASPAPAKSTASLIPPVPMPPLKVQVTDLTSTLSSDERAVL